MIYQLTIAQAHQPIPLASWHYAVTRIIRLLPWMGILNCSSTIHCLLTDCIASRSISIISCSSTASYHQPQRLIIFISTPTSFNND